MVLKRVHKFIIKAGESTTDQPNGNGKNAKLKAFYNSHKYIWDEGFKQKNTIPHISEFWFKYGVHSK